MQARSRTSPYEILCHHCNVTFPIGTKRCVHCGGRLGRRSSPSFEMSPTFEEAEQVAEEEKPRRSSFLPAALLWALLFAGMSIHRACSSG